ncbi:hypothetical protein GCM10023184_05030 [Flaviaesturariibacter amylovorans]|uniref:TonB C-terminal domain-containing protein n=1 Tax=Flaviaesturariibacter amylovorans TaxID=1084520 RepID=A0ABP8G9E2_9BACT
MLTEVQQVMPAATTYTINPAQPYGIESENGTTVYIPADAFVVAGTGLPPEGPVAVRVVECNRTGDILAANLSTTSQGRLLETGGMLYIDAQYNGQPCTLAAGKSLDLTFPYDTPRPGMRTFTGRWDGRQMDWTPRDERSYRTIFDGVGFEMADDDGSTGAYFPPDVGTFEAFCREHFRWPTGTEGPITPRDVRISFVINEYGAAERVRVHNSPSAAYDAQVAAAFAQMPCWIPAQRLGMPKANAFTQDLQFWWPFNAGDADSLVKVTVRGIGFDSLFTMYTNVPGRYRLRTTALGWINCDRFYNEPGEKVEFYVDAGSSKDVDVKLVFHSIRSVMQGRLQDDRFVFTGIPVGMDVTIVAMKADGSVFGLALKPWKTAAGTIKELAFEEVTLGCLKERLSHVAAAAPATTARAAPPAPLLTASR